MSPGPSSSGASQQPQAGEPSSAPTATVHVPFASPSLVSDGAGPSAPADGRSGQDHSYAVVENSGESPRASRGGARLVGDVEGVRQSVGDWQSDPNVKWAPRHCLLPLLPSSVLSSSRARRQYRADYEERCYLLELAKPALSSAGSQQSQQTDQSKKGGRSERLQKLADQRRARQRRQQQRRQQQELEQQQVGSHSSEEDNNEGGASTEQQPSGARIGGGSYSTRSNRETGRGRYSQDYEDPRDVASQSSADGSHSSHEESDDSSSSSGHSTDYSDWTAEQGINLEPPKRTAHRQKKSQRPTVTTADSDDDTTGQRQQQPPPERASKRKRKKNPRYVEDEDAPVPGSILNSQTSPVPARTRREVSERINNMNESSDSGSELIKEIPVAFRTPEWLTETQPKRAPYFPQMGDQLVYFKQGHMLYVDAVIKRKIYNIDVKYLPWNKSNSPIKECEFVKIIGMKFEIRPPRLCCLKLAIMDPNTNRLSADSFTLKYHDIPDVLDFFVLKQTYDASIRQNWSVGDRFRCIIDDAWWLGTIERHEPHLQRYPESDFLCYTVQWDNGETERLSPWDMEPIDHTSK